MSLLLALTASGSGPQTITGTLFTNTNSFGAGVVVQTSPSQTIVGTLFVNTNSFGAGVVTGGTTETPVTGGGGGGWIGDSRTPAQVERDRRRQWEKEDDSRADIRRQILAVVEPVTTETQLETAEQSDAAAITLAQRIVAKPDTLSRRDVLKLATLIQELQAAIAEIQAQQQAAQQEEEAIIMLLLAA